MKTLEKGLTIILDVIDAPGMRQVDIVNGTGLTKSFICKAMPVLEKMNLVEKVNNKYYPGLAFTSYAQSHRAISK